MCTPNRIDQDKIKYSTFVGYEKVLILKKYCIIIGSTSRFYSLLVRLKLLLILYDKALLENKFGLF